MKRHETFIKTHPLYNFFFNPNTLTFLDCDNTVITNFFHSLSDEFTNFGIERRNSCHLFNTFTTANFFFNFI